MTVSFWLNQSVADDGSLKSNRTLVVDLIVVVGAIVVGVVVVGATVAVVAVTVDVVVVASDAHALRSEMANVLSNNFVRNAISEFYH
jgi:voltage-gated potassium channel Kch